MKFLLATIALLCTTLTVTALPANCTTAIPRNSCAFYDECLETTYPCGASGYAIGYGGKYCRAFGSNANKFSSKGRTWITEVMHCLQTELVPLVTSNASKTCPEIKQFAFDTHPKCYLQAGVCTLPFTDWLALANVIGLQQLIGDLDAIKQQFVVAVNCPNKWLQALVTQLANHRE